MMSIIALVSSLVGMVGRFLPDIIQMWTAERAAKNERALLELTTTTQIRLAEINKSNKLDEIQGSEAVETIRAMRDEFFAILKAQSTPTGMPWVDALNAYMRPVCAMVLMALFAYVTFLFSTVVLLDLKDNSIDWETAAKALYGGFLGETFMCVFGFVFGNRVGDKVRKS